VPRPGQLVLAVLLVALLAPRGARADKVDDLIAVVQRKPDGMDRETWKEKRRAAARELGKLGDKRAVPALIRVVETEQFDVVGEISIEALGQLGDKRAAPALKAVIDDPSRDRYVREAAQRALKRVGGAPASSDPDPDPDSGSDSGSDSDPDPDSDSGSDTGDGVTPEPEGPPTAATFADDLLGAVDRLTFALGGARLEYDTVRRQPSINGDIALGWERERWHARSAYFLRATGDVVAGFTDYEGVGQSSRYGLGVIGGVGEGRFYLEGPPLYGFAAIGVGTSVENIKLNLVGTDMDVSETIVGFDGELAIGAGYGRFIEIGEALRLRRLESVLRRARALGRPITADLAERVLATWWSLRGEQGAHRRLTATVAILREAGVLLGEPDASLTYQILQVLLDGQLQRRPSGLDIQLGIAESYLIREDTVPVEDGRIESVFVNARYGMQSADAQTEIVGRATARYRILPEEMDPTPWGALAEAYWRNYFYNAWSDPIGALEIGAEVGASTDGFEMSEKATRVGGSVAWLLAPNRASQMRLAGQARWETGELFVGALFEVRFGVLDAVYVGSAAYP
jgi:hypothetical protein